MNKESSIIKKKNWKKNGIHVVTMILQDRVTRDYLSIVQTQRGICAMLINVNEQRKTRMLVWSWSLDHDIIVRLLGLHIQ